MVVASAGSTVGWVGGAVACAEEVAVEVGTGVGASTDLGWAGAVTVDRDEDGKMSGNWDVVGGSGTR